jgi:hypothetical protein
MEQESYKWKAPFLLKSDKNQKFEQLLDKDSAKFDGASYLYDVYKQCTFGEIEEFKTNLDSLKATLSEST